MIDRFDKIASYLRTQATPRSLIGLGILAVMLAAVGIGSLIDATVAQRQHVRELDRSVAVQRSLANGQEWIDAVSALQEQREVLESRFWTGATSGIVAAQLQSEIEDAAEQAGLDRIRIEVQPLPEVLAADGRLRFEISLTARDRDGQFLNFFQQLQDLDAIVIPTDFEWRRANASVRATLVAPAIVTSSNTTGGEAT